MNVSVHLNLNTGKLIIADKPKGTILSKVDAVTLTGVTFKVSEAQRQYCITHKGRWVHAWALGTLAGVTMLSQDELAKLERVTYNPYRAPTFHVSATGKALLTVPKIHFQGRYGYIAR